MKLNDGKPGIVALHPFQESIYFDQAMDFSDPRYNVGGYLEIVGELSLDSFLQAVSACWMQSDVLRVSIESQDGVPVQRLHSQVQAPPVTVSDLRSEDNARVRALAQFQASMDRAFDLEAGSPLVDFQLVQVEAGQWLFHTKCHHLVADATACGILMQSILRRYEQQLDGAAPKEDESLAGYFDAVAEACQYLDSPDYVEDRDYWRSRLAQSSEHREPLFGQSGSLSASVTVEIPADLRARLDRICSATGSSVLQLSLAALAVCFARQEGRERWSAGIPLHNRTTRRKRRMLGLLVNTIPSTVSFRADTSLRDWLDAYKLQLVQDMRHRAYPIHHLQRDVRKLGGPQSLFDVVVNYDRLTSDLHIGGASISAHQLVSSHEKIPLHLRWCDYGDAHPLRLHLDYNRGALDDQRAARLIDQLLELFGYMEAGLDRPLGQLALSLAVGEQHQLQGWNETRCSYPADRCLQELFEVQVAQRPDAVAVVHQDCSMTYGELNARANRLARHLVEQGVKPDALVGLCAERGLEMIEGLLAIVKAGGAYVPLDPSYPADRLAYMLEDSAVQVLLTQKHLKGELPVPPVCAICLDDDADRQRWSQQPADNIAVDRIGLRPHHLAYVIYTSGSTGKPKGVMVEHRAVVRLAKADDYIQLNESSVVAQVSNTSFDAATFEIWGALLNGGRLVHVAVDVLLDPTQLKQQIERDGLSAMFVTTALFHRIAQAEPRCFATMDSLLVGGEAVSKLAMEAIVRYGKPRSLLNVYGPTEATTFSSWFEVTAESLLQNKTVPIGRGMGNARLHVIDCCGNPGGADTLGELYIEGDGLARGYLNQPALTDEKFAALGTPLLAGRRLYHTGDLVRWNPLGQIEFLGRVDRQEKVRGFRIELGEVESALCGLSSVREALVVIRKVKDDKRLVSYVVLAEGAAIDPTDLRAELKRRLPGFMVPEAIVVVDEFPLTPNGKIDRALLPEPVFESGEYVAPQGELETTLAKLWQEVLGLREAPSMTANFFEQGGHSLLATRLVAGIRQVLGVELPLRRLFESPTLAGLARECEQRSRGAQVLIERAPREEKLPLSFAQQRLWFIDELEGQSAHYNMPFAVRLRGALDVAALERALDAIVQRHEVLRTTVAEHEGSPYQRIADDVRFELKLEDCNGVSEAELRERLEAEAQQPFDLRRDLMLRASVLKTAADEHILLLNMHHIASDGWSIEVLGRELAALYGSYSRHEAAELDALPIQYADYAWWQRQQDLSGSLSYWKQQLAGIPPVHSLPLDHARPAVLGFAGAVHESRLSTAITERLKAYCQSRGATLFMGLHAVFAGLLNRYSGQDDLVIGSPIANREQAELAGLIGFFVNTLVLRSDLSANPNFEALLNQSRETALQAYAHQQVPFEHLVEALQPQRSLSHAPLFQVMLVLQNNAKAQLQLGDLGIEPMAANGRTAKYDLTLNVVEGDSGLELGWEFSTALFEPNTIEQLAGHFERLLAEALDHPQAALRELPLLSAVQEHQLLHAWNDTKREYPSDKCLHELFEAQAARTPDAVAVVYEGQSLTYGELNARANRLARHLVEQGVKPDMLVGLSVERSLEMIEGLLAIVKAGGAYVPLDPSYPAERLAYMLEDSAAQVLLTQKHLKDRLPTQSASVLCLDDEADRQRWSQQAADNIAIDRIGLQPHHLAYVIYTSGSTGKPKGVMIEHRQVARLLSATRQWFGFGAQDVWTVFHSYAFDFSVWEIWGALAYGGRAVIVPHLVARSPQDFLALLEQEGVTVLNQTPTAFRSLIPEVLNRPAALALRYVIFGGEALNFSSLAPWYARFPSGGPALINMYGITETTVHVTYSRIAAADVDHTSSVIGRPIRDLQIYVLDRDGHLAPPLFVGELHVGGAGVARGYLNRPELTAQRFIDNPFGKPGERLYRTGDLGRYRADGSLEYFGRIDHQVKIRGFRIELGEIEDALALCPGVAAAVVIVRDGTGGEKRLQAFAVARPDSGLTTAAMRTWLQRQVPEHMVPAHYGLLEALPMTPNGKIDTNALPAPEAVRDAELEYVAPRTPGAMLLCELMAEALGIDRVGVTDNFFALGGDSMLAVTVAHRARQSGLALTVRDLFRHQTIADVLKMLEQRPEAAVDVDAETLPWARADFETLLGRDDIEDAYPLTAMQSLMVEAYERAVPQGEGVYHPQMWVKVRQLNASRLAMQQAVQMLVDCQPVLRTALARLQDGRRVQVVRKRQAVSFRHMDLSDLDEAGQKRAIEAALEQDRHAPLLSNDSGGQRFQWFDLGNHCFAFAISVHHAIDDGWGNQHYLAALWDLYSSLCAGETVAAPRPIANVFKEYVALEHQARALDENQAFWRQQVLPCNDRLSLRPATDAQPRRSDHLVEVSGPMVDRLQATSRRHSISIKAIALSAYFGLVREITSQPRVTVGIVANGRSERLSDPLTSLGLFWNLLPVASCDTSDGPAIEVSGVHRALTALEPHTLFPLGDICQMHGAGELFFATFNFTNFHNSAMRVIGSAVEILEEGGIDRFDYPLNLQVGMNRSAASMTLRLSIDERHLSTAEAEHLLGRFQTYMDILLDRLESGRGPQ